MSWPWKTIKGCFKTNGEVEIGIKRKEESGGYEEKNRIKNSDNNKKKLPNNTTVFDLMWNTGMHLGL